MTPKSSPTSGLTSTPRYLFYCEAELSPSHQEVTSEWGVPQDLEAALQWDNGKTYFFKGGGYWRFNDRRFAVDRAKPPFPRNTAEWWLGCPRVQQLHQVAARHRAQLDNISPFSLPLLNCAICEVQLLWSNLKSHFPF